MRVIVSNHCTAEKFEVSENEILVLINAIFVMRAVLIDV